MLREHLIRLNGYAWRPVSEDTLSHYLTLRLLLLHVLLPCEGASVCGCSSMLIAILQSYYDYVTQGNVRHHVIDIIFHAVVALPVNTQRRNNVVSTSKRRYYDVCFFSGFLPYVCYSTALSDFMYLTDKTSGLLWNRCAFRDSSLSKCFVSLPDRGPPLNKSICILSFYRYILWIGLVCRKANRKSQNLSPCQKSLFVLPVITELLN